MTAKGITINGVKMSVNDAIAAGTQFQTDENGHVYRKYDFLKTTPIPVCDYRSTEAEEILLAQKPVILKGSHLVEPANKWTLDYLEKNVGNDDKNVFVSKTHKFMYFNENRGAHMKGFKPPTKQVELTFKKFAEALRMWKPGDDRLYYQQMLTSSVGAEMFKDFRNFHWSWLEHQVRMLGWAELTSNLLLIGQPGNITPVHYDEQQNFFAQVHGHKRVILFHPKYFRCLYPYPYHHPCDRQSQVDFEAPDFERYPLLKHAKGMEAVVGPGDVLYIPVHWYEQKTVNQNCNNPNQVSFEKLISESRWHYIESTQNSELTTSINFWYKNGSLSLKDLKFPLNWQQKTTMTRNVEKMLGEALGSPSEIGPFLHTLVNGRYLPEKEEDIDFEAGT